MAGIEKLEYRIGGGAWADMPDPLNVFKDTTTEFRAQRKPTPMPPEWFADKPAWGGEVGGNGVETNQCTFTTVSHYPQDLNVYAECGNTLTGRVGVYNVDIDSGPLYLPVGGGVFLCLTEDSTDEVTWELTPEVDGGAWFDWTFQDWAWVCAGSVSTSYTIRATADGWTNCWDEVGLTVIKADIVESLEYAAAGATSNVPLHLSADSWSNIVWSLTPDLGSNGARFATNAVVTGTGSTGSGTNVWITPGSVATSYTIRAEAAECSSCFATATVVVVRADIAQTQVVWAAGLSNNASFSLTADSTPGLTWTLYPVISGGARFAAASNVTGAGLSTTGATAWITPGVVATTYVVRAQLAEWTNSFDTASLIVISNYTILIDQTYLCVSNVTTATAWAVTADNVAMPTNSDWTIPEGADRVAFVSGVAWTNALTNVASVAVIGTNASASTNDVRIHAATASPARSDDERVTVLKVDLTNITFSASADNYFAVRKDDDSADYDGPHWQDNNLDGDADDAGEHKYPVAYTRNTKAKVEAKFKVQPVPSGVTVKVKGDGPGNLDIPETLASLSGDIITISATEMAGVFTNAVDYLNPLAINWQVSFDGGASWCVAGKSENEVFVVMGTPGCAKRFRTVMYLACKNTGGTDAGLCLTNTWTSFSGPANVCAWDETTKHYSRHLHYYETPSGHSNTSTTELLADADGQCHAWAHFLKECLLVNNVGSQRTRVNPPAGYDEFFVRNVVFDDVNPTYPADDPWNYDESDLNGDPPPAGAEGIPGQNMTTPAAKRFERHFIVCPTGSSTYYDPSYGTTASSADNYTTNSINAWEDWISGAYHWRKTSSAPSTNLQFSLEAW